ncbi:MAG: NAD(P)/FAD-dependent oxidoreductase [Archaeoglobus sp.]|nr:NAD(P)/FAD-dependent oxidoreductase [Archaeoglobus sp.]
MDILIVGAGPAGSLAALNLKIGNITIIEEHQAAGFPVQCAGLISDECYESLKKYSRRCFVNRIRGAFFFSPNGNYIEMVGKRKGVVIERKILDVELLSKASEIADVLVKTKFVGVSRKGAKIIQNSQERFLKYDYLIGADGANSKVAAEFSFSRPEFYSAVQVEATFEPLEENMVELYFGSRYSDGFFAYAIPIGDGLARVGVVSKRDPLTFLRNLIDKHPSAAKRFKGSYLELNAGIIPIGLNEIVNGVDGNVCLIGDSAGMVKPYTGGGLYYHLIAAEILGKSFPDLELYKKRYLEKMGKEYSTGLKILKLYSVLSDSDYNELVKLGKDLDFSKLDMDHPSSVLKIMPTLIKKVALKPKLYAKLARHLLV